MKNPIKEFLEERKADKIKTKIKKSMTDEEKSAIEGELDATFSLKNWLPNAAKRAGQLSLVTHPAKFSHPSSKTSSVIAQSKEKPDGFLRTGNEPAEADVFGNAAALDTHKFLSLPLEDGKSILAHLKEDSETIRKALQIPGTPYEEIRDGFLQIEKRGGSPFTSGKVKQVYFPLPDGGYHLLSLLTPSGMVFKLKEAVDRFRFSDEAKEARKCRKEGRFHEKGFSNIVDLTVMGFGGSKPQNISMLNSRYHGKAYLLSSLPPPLDKHNVRLPKKDFFHDCLWDKLFTDEFDGLQRIIKSSRNNVEIREERDRLIHLIIDRIVERMWTVRGAYASRRGGKAEDGLPEHQRLWLYLKEEHENPEEVQRETSQEPEKEALKQLVEEERWLVEIRRDLVRWIINTYKKRFQKEAAFLDDDDLEAIRKIAGEREEELR